MNASQNTPASVWVVNVIERIDGVYVFATEAQASMFELALGDTECSVSEEPVNDGAGTAALVEAERDGDE